jgi:tetratricopeptide (TPR) repeat protein
VTEERWPLDYRHGRLSLGDALTLDGTAVSRLTPGLSTGDLARAAFVDVETTGLAGGTGTYVVLVGLGTFEDRSFRLRQFFLAHLGFEAAMLAAVSEALANRRVIVSFNGRRFDLPILETRFILNRLQPTTLGLPHLDLLYPARRLYRQRLSSCRLASLEEALLRVHREDDLPGWAIPGLYIDYLREGRTGPLPAVFRHNALDILSLVTLLGHLGRVAGEQLPADPDDCLALARWDEMEGRLTDAASLYEAALRNGFDEEVRTAAARRLARLCRRLGRWDDQVRVLRDWLGNDGTPSAKLEALVELAKMEEHRQRDYASAEALTRQALALVEVMTVRGGAPMLRQLRREALEHRLWRLRRRTCPT